MFSFREERRLNTSTQSGTAEKGNKKSKLGTKKRENRKERLQ
jgi:hypothetical protein